jgi:hypothetical protein
MKILIPARVITARDRETELLGPGSDEASHTDHMHVDILQHDRAIAFRDGASPSCTGRAAIFFAAIATALPMPARARANGTGRSVARTRSGGDWAVN